MKIRCMLISLQVGLQVEVLTWCRSYAIHFVGSMYIPVQFSDKLKSHTNDNNDQQLLHTWSLLGTVLKWFNICSVYFDYHICLRRLLLSLLSVFRHGNWGTEKLNNFSQGHLTSDWGVRRRPWQSVSESPFLTTAFCGWTLRVICLISLLMIIWLKYT